eukprot:TRINITY_DN14454_c0_g1_i1.p1 TRINITY_DN14454_c0_g1~~TRINITY_DN14454_c0_g1_i1.p1  ORF type:complete len:1611 (-),score=254.11 TRINITY_DN14454_c0_g1_i1:68-4900(-)
MKAPHPTVRAMLLLCMLTLFGQNVDGQEAVGSAGRRLGHGPAPPPYTGPLPGLSIPNATYWKMQEDLVEYPPGKWTEGILHRTVPTDADWQSAGLQWGSDSEADATISLFLKADYNAIPFSLAPPGGGEACMYMVFVRSYLELRTKAEDSWVRCEGALVTDKVQAGTHVGAVLKGNAITWYLDGEICTSGTQPGLASSILKCAGGGTLTIGDSPGLGYNFNFIGYVRDVRVYPEALDASAFPALSGECKGGLDIADDMSFGRTAPQQPTKECGEDNVLSSSITLGAQPTKTCHLLWQAIRAGSLTSCSAAQAVSCPVACGQRPLCRPPRSLNFLDLGVKSPETFCLNSDALNMSTVLDRCEVLHARNTWPAYPSTGRRLGHVPFPSCPGVNRSGFFGDLQLKNDFRVLHKPGCDFAGSALQSTLSHHSYTVYYWSRGPSMDFSFMPVVGTPPRRNRNIWECFQFQTGTRKAYIFNDEPDAVWGNSWEEFGLALDNTDDVSTLAKKWTLQALIVNGTHTTFFSDGEFTTVPAVPRCNSLEALYFVSYGLDPANVTNYSALAFVPFAMSMQQMQQVYYEEGELHRYHVCQAGQFRNSQGICEDCGVNEFSEEGATSCSLCPKGSEQPEKGQGSCIPCSPGMFSPQRGSSCAPCPLGTASELPGAYACQACNTGFSAPKEGTIKCEACAAGRFQNSPGRSECLKCEAGTYTDTTGLSTCSDCKRGSFQNMTAQTSCNSCSIGLTTVNIRSRSSDACTCLQDSYYQGQLVGCVSCSEGLQCPGGLSPPLQAPGFQIQASSEDSLSYEAFRCAENERCPGGTLPGTCAAGREGLACDACKEETYARHDGTCGDCSESNAFLQFLPFLIVGILMAGFVLYGVHKSRGEVKPTNQTQMAVTSALSLTVTSFQAFGSISGLNLSWVQPMTYFKTIAQLFTLNIEVVQLGCVFPVRSPLSHYAASLLIFPALLLVVLVSFGILKILRVPFTMADVCNTEGKVLVFGFIALSLLVFKPLHCIKNPSGKSTLQAYRSVVCWESSEHAAMLGMSAAATVVLLLSFLWIVSRATFVHQRRIKEPRGIEWLKSFDFLFGRFRHEHYYYGLVHLVRCLLLALLPSLPFQNVALTMLLLMILLISMLCIQLLALPWRTLAGNLMDIGLSISLMLVCLGGSVLSANPEHEDTVQVFFTVLFIIFFGGLLLVMLYKGYQIFKPPKRFNIFLSHHKGGAQVTARYFKLVLADKIAGEAFLDCDNLESLDELFSVVAEGIHNIAIILTQQTLCRMWCAGEIVTSFRAGINIVPIECPDYTAPDDAFLADIGALWTDEQKSELATYDIEVHHIQDSYRKLRDIQPILMPHDSTNSETMKVINMLVTRCTNIRPLGQQIAQHRASNKVTKANLAITCNMNDMEAHMTCRTLQKMLQQVTMKEVCVVQNRQDVADTAASVVQLVVILTRGVLGEEHFADVLLEAEINDVGFVLVAADPMFVFPDSNFYQELLAGRILRGPGGGISNIPLQDAADLYKALFKTLAVGFTPFGSLPIQTTQVESLASRIDQLVMRKTNGMKAMSTQVPKEKSNVEEKQTKVLAVTEDASPDVEQAAMEFDRPEDQIAEAEDVVEL